MTPKEKAKELYQKFHDGYRSISSHERAKQCALICVDEIIDQLPPIGMFWQAEGMHTFWQSVKQAINEL